MKNLNKKTNQKPKKNAKKVTKASKINNTFKCSECKQLFTRSSSLKRHYEKIHRVECPIISKNNQIKQLKERIAKLESDIISKEKIICELKVELQSYGAMSGKVHVLMHKSAPCGDNNEDILKDYLGNVSARFKTEKSKKYLKNVIIKFLNSIEDKQIRRSAAEKYIETLKGKGSTVNKKIKYIESFISYILFRPIYLEKRSYVTRPKAEFTSEEVKNFLEFMRRKADLTGCLKQLKLFFMCVGLVMFGLRAREFGGVTRESYDATSKKITMIDQKKRIKIKKEQVFTEKYNEIFKQFINNLETDEEKVFGGYKDFATIIRGNMLEFPEFEKYINSGKGFGPHCFRKTGLNKVFHDSFNSSLEVTKNYGKHNTALSTLNYIDTSTLVMNSEVESHLIDFDLIGKQIHIDPTRLNTKILESNYEISRKYFTCNFELKNEICTKCYLPFYEDEEKISCKSCFNLYHYNCEKRVINIWDNHCIHCYYRSTKGYLLRSHLQKYVDKCLCGNSMPCVNCNQIRVVYFKGKTEKKRRIFTGKLYKLDSHDDLKDSLKTALKSQRLKNYYENKYADAELDLSSYLPLDACPIPKYLKSIEKYPPVVVARHNTFGYYVYAKEAIKMKSVICEYLGDVYRELFCDKIKNNNSQLILNNCGTSEKNLILIPNKGANLGKYICGIKDDAKCNVALCVLTHDKKNRAILYAKRDINEDEILYWNYGEKYPMDNFVHFKTKQDLDKKNNQMIID